MSTTVGRSGHTWMKAHVAILLAVLVVGALIQPTASAATTSTSTTCSAQVLPTPTATPQQGPKQVATATHARHHHLRSAVVPRRGGRAHTGALTGPPEGLRPLGCLTLRGDFSRRTDPLLDRIVTTHPLRL